MNLSNVSTLIWVRLLVLAKGHLNQLVDIGTMHSLGMDNWNLNWFLQILLLKRLNGNHNA